MSGKASWRAGKSATSRPGAISISGPTGSISSPGWSTTSNASWSSSAPTSGAARNCWESPTAIARAPSRGASCCSISSGAASRWRPSWPSETSARLLEGLAREPRHDARTALLAAKTGNVLNKLPKSLQAKAKGHLQDIWLAETKDRAEKAFDFLEAYGAKYDKATACLAKDRAGPAHLLRLSGRKHLRTTVP